MEKMSVNNREQASNSHRRQEERNYYAEDLIDELKLFEVKEIKTGVINCNNSLITIDNQEIDLQNINFEKILKLNFDDDNNNDDDDDNDDKNYSPEKKAEVEKKWTKISKDLKNVNSHFLSFLGHSITSKQLGNNYQSIPQKLIIFGDKNFSFAEKLPRDEKKAEKEENNFFFRSKEKLTRDEKKEKIFEFGENNFSFRSGEETKQKNEKEEEINKFLHFGNNFSFPSGEKLPRDEEMDEKKQKPIIFGGNNFSFRSVEKLTRDETKVEKEEKKGRKEAKKEEEKIQKEEKMEQEKIQNEEKTEKGKIEEEEEEKIQKGEKIEEEKMEQEEKIEEEKIQNEEKTEKGKIEEEKIQKGEKIEEEKMEQEEKIQKGEKIEEEKIKKEEEDSTKFLIVTCPTECVGGEIKFPKLKKIFKPNSIPNKSLTYLLFDTKKTYQITKITSGSRILILYKITPSKITFDSKESQISTDTRKLKAILKNITEPNVLIPITKKNSLKKICDNLKLNYQQVYSAKETPKIVYGELDRNEMEFYYKGWEECEVDFYSLIRTSSRYQIGKIINYSRPEIINDILVRYRKYGTGPEESNYEVDYYSFLLINPLAMENCDSDPSEPDPSESDFTESDDGSEPEEEIENEMDQ